MSDATPVKALLLDAFQRVHDEVIDLTDGLTPEVAAYRPDPEANSIGWLLWHLARVEDDHVAGLAGVGQEGELASGTVGQEGELASRTVGQAWPKWRERFNLPFGPDATGYGQSPEEVGQVRADAQLIAGYYRDVHQRTVQYLDRLTTGELDRVVDTRWDPPVTVAVRLVSVIGDAMAHLGQAAYVLGLAQRRASAWQAPSAADR